MSSQVISRDRSKTIYAEDEATLSTEMETVVANLRMENMVSSTVPAKLDQEDEKLNDAVEHIVHEQTSNGGISIGDLFKAGSKRPPLNVKSPSLTGSRNKKKWIPTLEDVLDDKELLSSLLAFMERIYCSESILFLCAVQQFKKEVLGIMERMDRDDHEQIDIVTLIQEHDRMQQIIDFRARGIFNCYIVPEAPHQVKLTQRERNSFHHRFDPHF